MDFLRGGRGVRKAYCMGLCYGAPSMGIEILQRGRGCLFYLPASAFRVCATFLDLSLTSIRPC